MNHDYYYLNNYRNSGEMGISRRAIETIATLAVNQVEGAEIEKVDNKKKWNFFLNDPVRAFFRKDGRIELHLNVVIHKNINVQEICERRNNISGELGLQETGIDERSPDALLSGMFAWSCP